MSSLMNQFAIEAAANNDTVEYSSIEAIMASITVAFESDECEAVVATRDGVEHRYCRTRREVELIVASPHGGWMKMRCKATVVYFVRVADGHCVGQTAILPRIVSHRQADALTGRGLVTVVRDTIKFL